MFIDTHCHIDKKISEEYVSNAIKENVGVIITASEDLDSSLEAIEIANKYDNVYACVGVHPLDVKGIDFNSISEFRKFISNRKVKAIGEIGLDYYYSKEDKDLQIRVFREFLKLAEETHVPVVIHSREATMDTINILRDYKVSGLIHCFSGSLETANIYIKMGFSLGVGGVLTFKNSKLYEVIKEIPLSSIVLETDAPFLTPEPYRKYKNESKYIPVIARCLARYKGVSVEEVMEETTNNAKRIFDI